MSSNTAIITGAARGIGLATARLLQTRGVTVALVDRDQAALEEAATNLPDALPHLCDVSQPDQVTEMATTLCHQMGRVDILVNNASVADFGPIEETDFKRWRRVMATNLHGVFLCSQALVPAL